VIVPIVEVFQHYQQNLPSLKTTTYAVGNTGPGLKLTQTCDWIKL